MPRVRVATVALAFGVLITSQAANAQDQRVYRIGLLGSQTSYATDDYIWAPFLVLLCHESSAGPRVMTTRAARLPLEQGAGEPVVHRGDGRGHMAFRPRRERPAA